MPVPERVDKQLPIDERFFCDGHYYVLTSRSLGGSGQSPEEIASLLGDASTTSIAGLLARGICLPLFFDGDCAMDSATRFVVGALGPEHERAWIGRLSATLEIPCGHLVLVAGGGDGGELAQALSGKPPEPSYVFYQSLEVPPGTYQVDVLAYARSMTVALHEEDLEEEEIAEKYAALPEVEESYVIHLTPAAAERPSPALVPDVGWCGVFDFREPR
jgi:hypothetical protein